MLSEQKGQANRIWSYIADLSNSVKKNTQVKKQIPINIPFQFKFIASALSHALNFPEALPEMSVLHSSAVILSAAMHPIHSQADLRRLGKATNNNHVSQLTKQQSYSRGHRKLS
jgi:hypothetical protein